MSKKQNDKSFDSLPTCAAEYINLVIKLMRYRRKVRDEVRSELAAHFEDALKDCRTNEEKDKEAQKLITEFGDAKLLAILTRRAKKRCRSLWRTVAAKTFQSIGVLILCFILYLVYISLGKPTISVNYVEEAIRLTRPVADESLNAAPIYQKAIDAYNEPPSVKYGTAAEKTNLLDAIKDKDGITELTKEELRLLKQWLSDNADSVEFFKQAAEKPHCWWERKVKDDFIISVLMPELSHTRKLIRLIVWQARLKTHKGDVEGAFDDLLYCYRTGTHFKGPRSLVEQLVGIAIQATAMKDILMILCNQKIDGQLLKNFQSKFEGLIAEDTCVTSYEVEKFLALDFVQRCYTDNGRGSGHMIPGRVREFMFEAFDDEHIDEGLLKEFGISLAMSAAGANRREIRGEFEKFYNIAQQWATKTPWQLHKENVDFEMGFANWSSLKKAKYWPVLFLMPAILRVNERVYQTKADTYATLAAIAISKYKQDKGSYPSSLNDLTQAGYLKQIPIDPWGDKPLVYKKTEDGFTLYSVGPNFVDDGGRVGKDREGKIKMWTDNGDAIFWPVAE
jgi:hypothetical protein